MNIADIHEAVKKQREERFNNSNQLSLWGLINEIEKCGVERENGEIKSVCFDFGSAVPTDLDSWRGSYDELALGYMLSGYDNKSEHFAERNAKDLLTHLREAIGKEYTGWKGGDFTMSKKTPIWVSNSGNSGNTAVVGVLDDGWRLVIITAYHEY